MRIQPRTGKPKFPMGTRVLETIEHKLEATARRFNCSKSWVVAVALADFLGVHDVPRFNESEEVRRARREGSSVVDIKEHPRRHRKAS